MLKCLFLVSSFRRSDMCKSHVYFPTVEVLPANQKELAPADQSLAYNLNTYLVSSTLNLELPSADDIITYISWWHHRSHMTNWKLVKWPKNIMWLTSKQLIVWQHFLQIQNYIHVKVPQNKLGILFNFSILLYWKYKLQSLYCF